MEKRETKKLLYEISDNAQNKEKFGQIIDKLIELGYDGLQQDNKGFTPIMYAVKYNYVDIMERLLEYLKDIDISNNVFSKPLHIEDNIGNSLFNESKHKNSKLLNMINYLNQENKSALSYAMDQRNYDVACKLILHGASIDTVSTEQQRELLIYASRETHGSYTHQYHELRPVVGLLAIKVPEAVRDYSDDYKYPRLLSYFCAYGHTKVVASLLGSIQDNIRRIKIINNGDNHSTPLDKIHTENLTDDDHYKITKYLFENGATRTANNVDPVYLRAISACDNGHLKTFKYLENKADKKDFNTYIGLATCNNHINIIEYIWNKYRDYTTTYQGDTALHYAAWRGKLKSIKYLCEHGADVNMVNKNGETPLDYAIDYNTIEVIKYFAIEQNAKVKKYKNMTCNDRIKEILIARRDPVDAQEIQESTSLQESKIKNLLDKIGNNALNREKFDQLIDTLIELRYDGLQQDSKGFTPIMYAVKCNYIDIMERLLDYLKDIDISNNVFNNPLHIEDNIGNSLFDESKHKNSKLLNMINYLNQENKSALSYAMDQRNYDVACKLILHGANIDRVSTEQQRELLIYASRETHGSYTLQYHELRPVVGLLAIKVPEAVRDYSDDYEYPRLLSYFCAFGHTKVVASLLGSIQDNIRRIKIINNGDNNLTPLDKIQTEKLTDDDHYKITKYLFENGATRTANNVDPVYLRAISACDNGHLKTFKYLENKVDKKDFNTYIGLATRNDHMNIIEYIWNKYRDYTTTYQRDTVLHYAAWRGKLKSIKYLCERGADVNAVNNKGETPLDNAIDDNTIEVIKYFAIEQNAKVEKYKRYHDSMKKILSATTENVNNQDKYGFTLLHKAILTEKIIFIKHLCSLGCNVNAQNLQGITPLHLAAGQLNSDITKFLLQHGSIYDTYTNNNKTALDISKSRPGFNHTILSNIDFLFKSKSLNIDLNNCIESCSSHADAYDPFNPMVYIIGAKNSSGQTLLHKAVFLNDKDAVLLLLKYDETYQQLKYNYNHVSNYEKFDISAQDFSGNTCIHLAAAVGNKDIIDLFQDFKHVLNIRNNLGQTPINIAAKNGYKNCVTFMINKLNS